MRERSEGRRDEDAAETSYAEFGFGPFKIRLRGKHFLLTNFILLLIAIGMSLTLFILHTHSNRSDQHFATLLNAQQLTTAAQDEMNYILTLDQSARARLNLRMPHTLRKKLREGER